MKLPYQVVLVKRSENEKTPTVVLAHEIEVLKVLHGEDGVILTDDISPVKNAEFRFDESEEGEALTLADEYARLEQYYRGNENIPFPVREALGKVDDFVNSFEAGDGDEKESLLEQAKELGIKAAKTWGIEKLKAAIDAKLAE